MGFLDTAKKFACKHSTKIFAGTAIIAEILGFWFMHREAPVVHEKLAQLDENAGWLDKLKVAGPIYLPAIAMLMVSGGSIVAGCAVGEVKLAAMTNIAMMSEAALQKCQKQLVDTVGPEKAQQLHKEAYRDIMLESPEYSGDLEITKYGRDIFFDPLCRRKFTNSITHMKEAVVEVNNAITSGLDMWASVNDWYDAIGIKHAKLSGIVGWHIDHKLAIDFVPHVTESGEIITEIVYFSDPVLYNGNMPENFH